MFENYSKIFAFVIVGVLGWLGKKYGIPFAEGDLEAIAADIIQVVAWIGIIISRKQMGGVTWLGTRKTD